MTTTTVDLKQRALEAPTRGHFMMGGALAVLGFAAFAMFVAGADPGRAWRAYLVNFLFFFGLAQGGIIFAAIQKVTKARWGGGIVRFAEAGLAYLPVSIVLFVIMFLGRDHLFPWIAHPTPIRGSWLTTPFVFFRNLAVFALLGWVSFMLVRCDLKPDLVDARSRVDEWRRRIYDRVLGGFTGTPEQVAANDRTLSRLAPLLLVVYAYGMTLIAFDLIMSLAPYWVSTLLGAFFFIGAHLSGLTSLGLNMVFWRKQLGLESIIGRQQFHDLGKLIFGFSVFWAYTMFSQVLVIWYGNLPEETSFIFYRLWGEWRPISILVGLLVFLVPFWGLIWVKSKTTPLTFTLFSAISLGGMWLERYLLVQPSLTDGGPMLGMPEIGVTLGFLGLYLLAYGWFARVFPMVSPRLAARAAELHH